MLVPSLWHLSSWGFPGPLALLVTIPMLYYNDKFVNKASSAPTAPQYDVHDIMRDAAAGVARSVGGLLPCVGAESAVRGVPHHPDGGGRRAVQQHQDAQDGRRDRVYA